MFQDWIKRLPCLALSLVLSACASVWESVTPGLYHPPALFSPATPYASLQGSIDPRSEPLRPVSSFVTAVDGLPRGPDKVARCRPEAAIELAPGQRALHLRAVFGKAYIGAQVAEGELTVDLAAGVHYRVRAEFVEGDRARIWVENSALGTLVGRLPDLPLARQASTYPTLGLGWLENSCLLP